MRPFRPGPEHAAAEFVAAGRPLARRTFGTATKADGEHYLPGLDCNQPLVLVFGPEMMDLASGWPRGANKSKPVAVHLQNLDQLPADWYAYEGFDAVVLSTSRPELYHLPAGRPSPLVPLDEWVRMGGKLVLCGGAAPGRYSGRRAAERFPPRTFPRNGQLAADQCPGDLQRQHRAYPAGTGYGIAGASAERSTRRGRSPRGRSAAGRSRGRRFGQVVFVAADLDQPPLDRWQGRGPLWCKLLGPPRRSAIGNAPRQAVMHYGFQDLSGQLRKALSHFEGVGLASFWLVAVVGRLYPPHRPGRLLFLRKLARRMELTWITFPAIAIGCRRGGLVPGFVVPRRRSAIEPGRSG